MESTSKLIILNGMNFRVWEGVTAKGIPFVALVNRLESADPEQMRIFVSELGGPSKEPEATTPPALDRLGVNPGVPADYGDKPAPPTSTAA